MPEPTAKRGARLIQKLRAVGALSGNVTDNESKPYDFLMLKNCYVDKRLGGVVRRDGSADESIAGSLGIPLGMGEYREASAGTTIPISRYLLANFAGTFYQKVAYTWSAVSKTAQTSFNTSTPCQMAQLADDLYIAAGRPAKWSGPNTTIERMGIPKPTVAPTVTQVGGANPITATEGWQFMYTYYSSITGLESDWSPLSGNTGAVTSQENLITLTTDSGITNADQIRLYRTLDGGGTFYLVTTVAMGTSQVQEGVEDADLTLKADSRGNKALPPNNCFVIAKYAQKIWMVDADNPFKLHFSKSYTGSQVDLEYFPERNFVIANEPITGLLVIPGKMLVFHPRSISYISGTSEDDFVFLPFKTGVGTMFANSVATNGTNIVCLAEQGWVDITQSPSSISREIDEILQPILSGQYNAAMYASCVWSPAIKQFLCMIVAQRLASEPWEEVGTGDIEEWEDSSSLATEGWENPENPNPVAVMNIRMWGWAPEFSNPEKNRWHEYTWPTITDANSSGAYPVYLFHPMPSADTGEPQQDRTFMGYYSGSAGKVRGCFRKDKTQDDSTTFTAEFLTGRISPGDESGAYKRVLGIGFSNAYSDLSSSGTATQQYLLDFDDPHLRSFAASLKTVNASSTDYKTFPEGLCRFLHLYFTDTTNSQNKLLLGDCYIHYRERARREGR